MGCLDFAFWLVQPYGLKVAMMNFYGRTSVLGALAGTLALGGCMSPTYGTGTSASEQLLSDVSSLAAVGPAKDKPKIDYNPRPELVKPASTKNLALPAPQESVASSGSAQWPESPEERRKRFRDDATANRDNPNYVPKVRNDMQVASTTDELGDAADFEKLSPQEQREEFLRRQQIKKIQTTGTPTTRRYLSEPPVTYRAPAETAAVGELGEDEKIKEKNRMKSSTGGSKWWKPWE